MHKSELTGRVRFFHNLLAPPIYKAHLISPSSFIHVLSKSGTVVTILANIMRDFPGLRIKTK